MVAITSGKRLLPVSAAMLVAVLSSGNGVALGDETEMTRAEKKAEAIFQKGHKAFSDKKLRAAEQLYRKAIAINPNEASYHRQLSVLLTAMERGQEAEREALMARSIDPEDWHTLLVLAHIYHRKGRLEEELKTCESIVKLLPKEEKALLDKVNAHMQQVQLAMREASAKEKKKREEYEAKYRDAL